MELLHTFYGKFLYFFIYVNLCRLSLKLFFFFLEKAKTLLKLVANITPRHLPTH
jgi:hypothetical protein